MSAVPSRLPAIVVVGSLHYDIMLEAPRLPVTGETLTGHRWYPKFGGKGGNQAVAAATTGADVRFVGAVGDDDFGAYLLRALGDAGLSTERVDTFAGTGSGMSVAIQDAEGDYSAVVVSGTNALIDTARFDEPALWADVGTLILQNEIPESVNIAAASRAREVGARVCLNAAPARALSPALIGHISLLVVNAIEAEQMSGLAVHSIDDARRAASALAEQFPSVVVTAGRLGSVAADSTGNSFTAAASKVDLISTHGAGDVYTGHLCHALTTDAGMQASLEIASQAAARHISTPRAH